MPRYILTAVLAALVVTIPAEAKRAIRVFTPLEKLVRADVMVVGKVTALEKEMVTATPAQGDPNKISYKLAVVKVENALLGAANLTHIKVGFVPPPPSATGRPIRGGFRVVNLTEGMEGLFYLTKHHSGQFYIIHPLMAPTDSKSDGYKEQLALAKKGAAALADPMKLLKSDKADDRSFAASVLVRKYRAYPEGGGVYVNAKIGADESRLILKGLAEASWKPEPNGGTSEEYMAFGQLGLTNKDGWKYPMVKPGEDFVAKTHEAFAKWVEGPGKDYRINKWVPKK